MNFTIDIRPRRQATFPAPLLQMMGIGVGDSLEVEINNNQAVLRPKKQLALDALKAIQTAFRKAKIPEKAMFNR